MSVQKKSLISQRSAVKKCPSGHNRNFELKPAHQGVRQAGEPHGREAVDTGGQPGGGQGRWLAGCFRPMNRKAGRGNLWPRLSAPEWF